MQTESPVILIICEILIRILSQCVFLLYFRFVSLREEMPGKKQLDSDSSALCGGAALAGTTPKGVGPPNGGQTLVRVVASQTFAYETKRGWRTFWIYYLYAPKKLTCLNLTENKNPFITQVNNSFPESLFCLPQVLSKNQCEQKLYMTVLMCRISIQILW